MSVSRKVQMGAGGSGGDPWTFDDATFNGGAGTNGQYNYNEFTAKGVVFKDDGTEMVVLTSQNVSPNYNTYLESYALGTPYVVSSATRTYQQAVATNAGIRFGPLRVNNDGTRFYYGQTSGATIPLQVELSTGWDLSSFVSETVGDTQLQNISSYFLFNGAGTTIYMFPSAGTSIKVFSLSTAWDITSGVTAGTDITSISGQGFASVSETGFCPDGSVLYIKDSGNIFTAVGVTTPFDLTTINWSSKTSNPNHGTNVVVGSARNATMGSYFCVTSTASATRIVSCFTGLTSAISSSTPSAADLVNFDIEMPSNVYNPPTSLTSSQNGVPWYGNLWTNFSAQFNSDGSNLVIGRHYNTSSEYFFLFNESLSTDYDISSSGYTTTRSTMFTSGNNIRALSFRFSEDGTKSIFMGGPTRNYVFSYSTPFDPSTSGAGVFFELDDLRLSPFYFASGAMFNNTMDEVTFAVSNASMKTTNGAYSYNLSPGLYTVPLGTPGDITTADTSGIGRVAAFVTGNQNLASSPNYGLEFNGTGSTCATVTDNYAYAFDLGLNYGAGSASRTSMPGFLPSFGSQTQLLDSLLRSFSFNDDGTEAYFLDIARKCIQTFVLPTPYDLAGVKTNYPPMPDNIWWRNDSGSPDVDSLTMNPSGTKLYRLQRGNGRVTEYPLSTAWDLSTSSATPTATLTTAASPSVAGGDIAWGDSGNKFYRMTRNFSGAVLERYAASTPYDLGSCGSTPDKSFTFGIVVANFNNVTMDKMFFKPDGTSVYMYAVRLPSNKEVIVQWDMSTAWDPTSIASTTAPDAFEELGLIDDDYAAGIHFKSDGSQLFVAQQVQWYKFDLGTNWDLSTISQPAAAVDTYKTSALPISSTGTNGLYVSPDETKVFVGTTLDLIIKTDFGAALDFRTISHDGGAYCWYFSDPQNVGGVAKWFGDSNNEFRWKPDGTSIYILGRSNNSTVPPIAYFNSTFNDPTISQFNLSSAWDLSTATYAGGVEVNNSLLASSIYTFDISSDGAYVILAQSGLYMGTMSTPWDITTLSTATEQFVGGFGWDDRSFGANRPSAVRWHPNNGTAIYTREMALDGHMATQKMTLTTPYDPTTAVAAIEGTAKFQEILPTNSIWGSWPGNNTYPYYSCFQFQSNGYYAYFLETSVDDTGESTFDSNIRAFSLSTPYDVTTATEMTNFQIVVSASPPGANNFTNSQASGSIGYFDWHPDGSKFIVTNNFLIGEYKV